MHASSYRVSRPLCSSEGMTPRVVDPFPARATPAGAGVHLHSVTAVMAKGKRPVTFRTRKLSLSAPMVLPGGPGGRVGHRRTYLEETGVGASRFGPRSCMPAHRRHSHTATAPDR